jgi:pimeloyl-ACP methyl ester carboxylesterase
MVIAASQLTGEDMAVPSQPSNGNNMDGYADDLAAVIEALDLKNVTLVGHSTGGGEVARYVGRHGSERGGFNGAAQQQLGDRSYRTHGLHFWAERIVRGCRVPALRVR